MVSYRVLDRRANGLAAELRSRGVQRGDLTPVIVRDGPELPVSVIALMKIGAPFVPIDDLWPASRVSGVVESMRPAAVVHGATMPVEPLPEDLCLPVDAEALPELGRQDFGEPAGMDDLAYGFYTSGSTGAPKCTLNRHRGLLNRFLFMTRLFGASGDDVALQNSRPVFDSSLWQLLWPLTKGARVVIPRRSGVLDLAATVDTVERYGVTTTDFVPSIFNALVDLMLADRSMVERLGSLQTVLIGGEEINSRAVQRFRSLLPDVRIVNTYGPTECSIGSVFHTVSDADRDSIPIGRPIDNTYVVVLDEDGELTAPGATGEIHIGGDCLGLGYLDDPARTADVFRVNPFAEIPGDRLYRTGDNGRWRGDGALVFEGRSDQQIKIGGVRVELSEIELGLLAHPQVREAKTIAQGDVNRVLIAFVTCETELTEDDLRRHSRDVLPPYLVPNRFVVLQRMPLTPNGKTDRKALAEMADTADEVAVADLEGTERGVQEIWHELLPGVQVASSDRFFDVGGDSLIAQRLALALNARFDTTLTVRDVVRHPTVAGQAALICDGDETPELPTEIGDDATLPEDIVPSASATVVRTRRQVLLTGATGFVGGHLAHELLRGTDAVLHCLVRAGDPATARERVIANLRRFRLWDPTFAGRLRAVPGDLGAPRLGLTDTRYEHLSEVVDTVLHNGAMVNLVREYGAHRPVNVLGTVEILRFACGSRAMPVHLVSTLSVLPAGGDEVAAPAPNRPVDGYSQSKLVGEWLADAAAARGLPIGVHRLGEVMPHSLLGVPSRDGLVDLLVRACIDLGTVFRSKITVDYLPVDRASTLITAAVAGGQTGYFHHRLSGGVRLDDVFDAFRRTFDLADLPYESFVSRVRSVADSDRDLARLAALLPAYEGDLPDLFSESTMHCSTGRADALAQSAGLAWLPIDEVLRHYATAMAQRPPEATDAADAPIRPDTPGAGATIFAGSPAREEDR